MKRSLTARLPRSDASTRSEPEQWSETKCSKTSQEGEALNSCLLIRQAVRVDPFDEVVAGGSNDNRGCGVSDCAANILSQPHPSNHKKTGLYKPSPSVLEGHKSGCDI
jgi:hypothetical protein